MSETTTEFEVQAPAPALPHVKVAVLGTGKMGGILLQALPEEQPLRSRPDLCDRASSGARAGALGAVRHRGNHR